MLTEKKVQVEMSVLLAVNHLDSENFLKKVDLSLLSADEQTQGREGL